MSVWLVVDRNGKFPCSWNAHAWSRGAVGRSLLSCVLGAVSACMIDLCRICSVSGLIQFVGVDMPYVQYRMHSAMLRNHLKIT